MRLISNSSPEIPAASRKSVGGCDNPPSDLQQQKQKFPPTRLSLGRTRLFVDSLSDFCLIGLSLWEPSLGAHSWAHEWIFAASEGTLGKTPPIWGEGYSQNAVMGDFNAGLPHGRGETALDYDSLTQ